MNEPGSSPAPISHEDLALYAMGSLPADEMAAVAAALRDNPQAQQELARIQDDLALLALSVDQQAAPAGSFERLQARIHETAQAGSTSVPAGKPIEMTATQTETATVSSTGRSKWAVITSSLNDALDGESRLVSNLAAKASRAQQVLEVLNAPDAQRVTLAATRTPPAPTAHAVYLAERGALVMEANNLKPVPAGKAYELWVMPAGGGAPMPVGTFWPNSEGYASIVLPHFPSGVAAKGFGITIENAGGSKTPTLPIVLSGE
jgi:anti-sigma-K factor RskA